MKPKPLLFSIIIVITLIFTQSCNVNQEESINIRNKDSLDLILNEYVDRGYYPFIYARLEDKNGDVLYEHSVVNKSLLPDTKIDGQTWIRIWSMSKIVTISLILDLEEDGILNLDNPVKNYIPEFSDLKVAVTEGGTQLVELDPDEYKNACPFKTITADSIMTIRHLINHKAGFYYSTGISCLDSMLAEKNLPVSENSDVLIDKLSELPLLQHPGTSYYYGTNTTVLGLVAERATGKSLKELVKERITNPLGIEGLQYGLPEDAELLPRFSGKDTLIREAHPGELNIFGSDVPDYDPDHELYLGGEGMIATTDGYADFLRMLLKEGKLNGYRFLEKSTVEEIHAPHTQLDNPYGHNGYNLWVTKDTLGNPGTGDGGLWIGGGYEGTHFWVDPKRDFVGLVMTQMFWIQPGGYDRDNIFRAEVYKQVVEK